MTVKGKAHVNHGELLPSHCFLVNSIHPSPCIPPAPMLTGRQPIGGAASGAPFPMGPSVRLSEEIDRVEHSGGIQASLSGRYATALFELARDAKAIDMVEASLARVRAAIDQSPEFAELIVNPIVSRGAAAKAIAASAELIDIDETTEKFLGVLAQNRRLAQLPAVIRAFRSLAADHRGETTAEVVSAHPLSETQVDALKDQLRARVGRDVAVDLSVDPSLLGGLVVKIGSQMIDSSIKTRLNTLAHAMKG
jgi:F-type H+-transporting ATPase subunit delta